MANPIRDIHQYAFIESMLNPDPNIHKYAFIEDFIQTRLSINTHL
jgi:hypothetical protein